MKTDRSVATSWRAQAEAIARSIGDPGDRTRWPDLVRCWPSHPIKACVSDRAVRYSCNRGAADYRLIEPLVPNARPDQVSLDVLPAHSTVAVSHGKEKAYRFLGVSTAIARR